MFHLASVPCPCLCRTASVWAAGSPTAASTVPSSCTTTTAPAGARWSSCPFPSTGSGAPTCASSFDTAPVSRERSGSRNPPFSLPHHPTSTIFTRTYAYGVASFVDVVYVTVCFLSAKDKGEKKLFGFAFTPLMREDGTTLSDESHELYVYKVCVSFNLVKYSLV